MTKRISVIVNAGAGGTKMDQKVADLRHAFSGAGVIADFFLSHEGTDTREVTRNAISKGAQIVVAAGGDGTINAVAAEALESSTTLGIIPFGTFNHLSKDLGIPQDLESAVSLLGTGTEKSIDVAEVNNRIFLNNSSIGIYSKIVATRQRHERYGYSKGFALLLSLLSLVRRYSFVEVQIEIEGQTRSFRSPLVVIGNNKYEVEGLNFGSRERLDEGMLSLFVVRHAGVKTLATLLVHAFKKTLRQHDLFEEYFSKAVTVRTKKPVVKVGIDGEIISVSSPLEYKLRPRALRVITK